jgi:assimilatory nitrate reductase catalytic subunit
MQCGMDLVVGAAGRVAIEARDFPVNRGGLCQKGWTAAALLNHEERLTAPLMRDRRGDELRPVSWDEALDRITTEIRLCQERHGRAAVGVFGGGGLTNEKALRLARGARSRSCVLR